MVANEIHPAARDIWALAAYQLPEAEARQIVAHMVKCSSCAALHTEFLYGLRYSLPMVAHGSGLPARSEHAGLPEGRGVDDALLEWARCLGSPIWVPDRKACRRFGGLQAASDWPVRPDEVLVNVGSDPVMTLVCLAPTGHGTELRVVVIGETPYQSHMVELSMAGKVVARETTGATGDCRFNPGKPGAYQVKVAGGSPLTVVTLPAPLEVGRLLEAFESAVEGRGQQLASNVGFGQSEVSDLVAAFAEATACIHVVHGVDSNFEALLCANECLREAPALANALQAAESGHWRDLRRWLGEARRDRGLPLDRELLALTALAEKAGQLDQLGQLSTPEGAELLGQLRAALVTAAVRQHLLRLLLGITDEAPLRMPVWLVPDRGMDVDTVESLAYQLMAGRLHWKYHGQETWRQVWEKFLALAWRPERLEPHAAALERHMPGLWASLASETRTDLAVGLGLWWLMADVNPADWTPLVVPLAHAVETELGGRIDVFGPETEAGRLLQALVERGTHRGSIRRLHAEKVWTSLSDLFSKKFPTELE